MGADSHARSDVHRPAHHRQRHNLSWHPAQPANGMGYCVGQIAALAGIQALRPTLRRKLSSMYMPSHPLRLAFCTPKKQKARKLALREPPARKPAEPSDYLKSSIRTTANIYSDSDSINTSPRIKEIRSGPAAPGLRAIPSQAEAVAFP